MILGLIFFYKYFFRGLIPIPVDFIVGVYYPWLDYKWANQILATPVKNPLLADVPSLIFPLKLYALEVLKKGHIPLWNPFSFGGYPLMANLQSAIFYPLNILFLFFNPVTAWSLEIVMQPILSMFFMYLFLRNLPLSKASSIAGSVIYAFSGFNMIWLEYNVHGHVSALIPLLLFLSDKFFNTKNFLYRVFFSLVLAIQILAGYPQLTLYSLILIAILIIYRKNKKIFKLENLKLILLLFIFGLIGFGIAGVELIPGAELLLSSQRINEGLSTSSRFLPFPQLITFLAPDYFGNPATHNWWGIGDYTSIVGYSGLVTIILSCFSLRRWKKEKHIRFFSIFALILIITVLPSPIANFVNTGLIPGSTATTVTRVLILFNFCLASLAAFGIDSLKEKHNLKVIVRSLYIPTIVLIAAFVGTTWDLVWLKSVLNTLHLGRNSEILITPINDLKIGLRNLIFPSILLILTGLILFLNFKLRKFTRVFSALLIVLIIFELFRFGWKYNTFIKKNFVYPKTPVLDFLTSQEKPVRFSGGDVIPISMWIPYKLESMSGYDAIYPTRVAKFIGVVNSQDAKAGAQGRYGQLNGYTSPLFDLTNTRYILAVKRKNGVVDQTGEIDWHFINPKLVPILSDRSVVILEDKKVLPRAFIVTNWQIIKSDKEILTKLLEKEFPLKEKIVLEKNFDRFSQSNNNQSIVRYLEYQPEKSLISVKTSRDGLLFISDTWYPGWKAQVDGKNTEILRADYNFRAIPVEHGEHQIKMYYDPESFKLGQKISLLSLALLAVMMLTKFITKSNYVKNITSNS